MKSRVTNRRRAVAAALVSVFAVALAGCGSSDSSGPATDESGSASGKGLPDTIPVTLIADVTGFAASYGNHAREGVTVAIDEVNESDLLGGSKIVLTVKDTGSDATTAATLVSQATQSDAVAILGPTLSNEALAVAPTAQRAGVPFISDGAPPGLADIGDYIFVNSPDQAAQAPLLAKQIASEADSAVIVYANDNPNMVSLHTALGKALEDAGVKVVDNLGTPIAATDFTALTTKAIDTGAKSVVLVGGGAMMPSIIKGLRTSGYEGKIFGNMGADGTLASSGPEADGFEYVTQWAPSADNAESKAFMERFTKTFPDSAPSYTTMGGYEAIKLLSLALAQAQSVDHAAVRDAMAKVAEEGFDSPSGRVTFGGPTKREKHTPGLVVQVSGDDLKVVATGDELGGVPSWNSNFSMRSCSARSFSCSPTVSRWRGERST